MFLANQTLRIQVHLTRCSLNIIVCRAGGREKWPLMVLELLQGFQSTPGFFLSSTLQFRFRALYIARTIAKIIKLLRYLRKTKELAYIFTLYTKTLLVRSFPLLNRQIRHGLLYVSKDPERGFGLEHREETPYFGYEQGKNKVDKNYSLSSTVNVGQVQNIILPGQLQSP